MLIKEKMIPAARYAMTNDVANEIGRRRIFRQHDHKVQIYSENGKY